ncbi:minor histocompatibility antigen H13-like [Sycon ciliatum]|uniref:minor histocompatibility antigen H13-like n=1 Tax=Sycon ciliatum TaxID=27933 RepID=UPI0031F6174D
MEANSSMNSSVNVSDSINGTNGSSLASSGIMVATKEGIIIAYTALVVLAVLPIIIGSIRSVEFLKKARVSKKAGEDVDVISTKDAMMFPVFASCALLGLYIVFKALGEQYVNWLLNIYIFIFSSLALSRALNVILRPILSKLVPKRSFYFLVAEMEPTQQGELRKQIYTVTGAFDEKTSRAESYAETQKEQEAEEVAAGSRSSESESAETSDKKVQIKDPIVAEESFDFISVICLVLAFGFGCWYLFQKHWFANNVLAFSFAVNGIEMISLNKVTNGCILLGGLFFYDVFWVFGTDVMVTVAKSFNAPIKLVFPMDLLENGWFAKNFALLGLGDIVIPGVFVALLLRFDTSRTQGGRLYFLTCLFAYLVGLLTTIFIMHYFKHAQPALLYLVPACLGFPFIVALLRGELSPLLSYEDHESETTDEKKTN